MSGVRDGSCSRLISPVAAQRYVQITGIITDASFVGCPVIARVVTNDPLQRIDVIMLLPLVEEEEGIEA